MMDLPPKRRSILENVLTPTECLELINLARCVSAVGYRDNCCAVTTTVIVRIFPAALPKLVIIRERIRDAVEQALGLELSLLIEFTGLVSWRPGASIGWHTDSNREYLTQRCAAAVVYLNEGGKLYFEGGNFKFRQTNKNNSGDIQIESVTPRPGLVVAYTTSEEHCVDPEIASGERFTLSMWFTTDIQYDEDQKVLSTLKELEELETSNSSNNDIIAPLPAAMHALDDGVDIRLCRLACYGVCILKRRENGAGWVPLKSLADGEWKRQQPLQLGILRKLQGGKVRIVAMMGENSGEEGAIKMSVQQAVVAVQGCLTRARSGGGDETVACEKVCARHLNAFPDRVAPKLRGEKASCSWLDESERIVVIEAEELGGNAFVAAEMKRLEVFLEAIRRYIDVEEPEQLWIWKETKEKWLKAGAVF